MVSQIVDDGKDAGVAAGLAHFTRIPDLLKLLEANDSILGHEDWIVLKTRLVRRALSRVSELARMYP